MYVSFKKAKEVSRSLGIKSFEEYRVRYKEGKGLPSAPEVVYKEKGWITWGDFLGTGNIQVSVKRMHSYGKAREIVRKHKVLSIKDYKKRYKEIDSYGLPAYPRTFYKKRGKWKSWGDFLGCHYGKKVS